MVDGRFSQSDSNRVLHVQCTAVGPFLNQNLSLGNHVKIGVFSKNTLLCGGSLGDC